MHLALITSLALLAFSFPKAVLEADSWVNKNWHEGT